MLRFSLFSAICALIPLCSCDCAGAPPSVDAGSEAATLRTCNSDGECLNGEVCLGGSCTLVASPHADAGSEIGPGNVDAGPPAQAQLQVLPGLEVEFGAQLIGVAVERDVTLLNAGNAPLTILAVILDDTSGEFSATPTGTLNEVLDPGDQMTVVLAHTPADGTPDTAELKVLHDGPGNIASIALSAAFKGDANFSITQEASVLEPNLETLDFGQADVGAAHSTQVFLRNTGRSDSILTLSDITLTPADADFSIAGLADLEFPVLLSSWSSGLCPDGDVTSCPQGSESCADGICMDAGGVPLRALALDVDYTPSALPATATLTFEHDAGGVQTQYDLTLLGSPTQPAIVVTPSTVDFGPTLVGAQPPTQTVQISNDGQGPLYVTRVTVPDNAAFSVTFDAPVPTAAGHPPLIIAPGGTPLSAEIAFSPDAANGYAGFLTIESNDAASVSTVVSLAGSGVVCQKDAHVNMAGACECDVGFNVCGAECLADSPTTCGGSCQDCTAIGGLTFGTDATCDASACNYSCEAGYYDLNDGSDGAPGSTSWDGCEYRCEMDPPLASEFFCNGIDDDCNGQIDEGLPTEAEEAAPGNNVIANASVVPGFDFIDATAGNPAPVSLTGHAIYEPTGGSDEDWYKVTITEGDGAFSCAQEIPCIQGGQENYQTLFNVISPTNTNYNLEIFVPSPPNFDDPNGAGVTLPSSATVTHDWNRSSSLLDCVICGFVPSACFQGGYGCAFDDAQVYFVHVLPAAGSTSSCEPYTLQVTAISLPPGAN